MKLTKRVLVGIGIFILILLQIGLFLPHEFRYERQVWVNSKPEAIFPYINDLKEWEKWTVLKKDGDRSYSASFEGESKGEGAIKRWTSEKNGDGTIEIVLSIENRLITYDKILEKEGFKSNGKIELIETDGGTTVIWTEEGDFGYNIFGRYIGLIMDAFEGGKLEKSLVNLKKICEE
jgi:hypothetical protein